MFSRAGETWSHTEDKMDDGQGYDYGQWLQNPVATFACSVDAIFDRVAHFYFNNGYLWWTRR